MGEYRRVLNGINAQKTGTSLALTVGLGAYAHQYKFAAKHADQRMMAVQAAVGIAFLCNAWGFQARTRKGSLEAELIERFVVPLPDD